MARRRHRKKFRLFVYLVLVIAVVAFFYVKGLVKPVELTQEVSLTVPARATTGTIAQILLEKGLIRSDFVFKVYAKIEGFEGKLRAGEYHFSGQVSLNDIREKMSGRSAYRNIYHTGRI